MLPTHRNPTSTDRLVIATRSIGDPRDVLEEIVEIPALDALGECFHFTCPPVARP
jgi:hypothetical protein